MISQKTGMEYLDNFKKINSFDEDIKSYNDNGINLIKDIKNLYYEEELFFGKKNKCNYSRKEKTQTYTKFKKFYCR